MLLGALTVGLVNGLYLRVLQTRADAVRGIRHDPRVVVRPGPEPGLRVRVLGDSAARGFGIRDPEQTFSVRLAHALADRMDRPVEVACLAEDGARTVDVLTRQLPDLEDDVDIVAIGVGVNDAMHRTPSRQVAEATTALLTAVSRRAPDAQVVFAVCPDLRTAPALPWPLSVTVGLRCRHVSRTQIAAIEELEVVGASPPMVIEFGAPEASHYGVDGFHPGDGGHARMTSLVLDALGAEIGATG